MKRTFLAGLLLVAFGAWSQTEPAPEFPSLSHQAIHSQTTYLQNLTATEAEASRMHKLFNRWSYFWSGRMDESVNGDSPNTLFDSYQSWQPSTNDWDWSYAGPGDLNTQNNGRVECAATPSGSLYMNEILIGTPTAGIWRSSDGGAHWNNVTDTDFGLPGMGCNWISYHPNNPNKVYAAMSLSTAAEVGTIGLEHGYGLGIFTSNDGGDTWLPTGLQFDPTEKQLTTRILVNPSNGEQMYAAVNDRVYYTSDGWENHQIVFDHLTQSFDHRKKAISDLQTAPDNFHELWVASTGVESWLWTTSPSEPNHHRWHAAELWHNSNTGVGATWETISTPLGSDYALYSNSPQPSIVEIEYGGDTPTIAYKFFESDAQVWQLLDGQWQLVFEHSLDPVGGEYQFAFLMHPAEENVAYLGQRRVYRAHFSDPSASPEILTGPHVDTRYLGCMHTTSSGEPFFLQGNDGGLAAVRDSAGVLLWENLNGEGLGIQQLFGLGLISGDSTRVVAGSQDNSGFRNLQPGWSKFLGGDRYDPVLHRNGSGIFPVNPNGIQTFSDLHGGSFTLVAAVPSGSSFYNRPVAQDQDTTAYVGYSDLWAYKPFGQWVQKSDLGLGKIRAIAVSEDGNAAAIAFEGPTWGGSTGKLYVTYDLFATNPTWTDITTGVALSIGSMGINALAFAPYNTEQLTVGFERFHSGQTEKRVIQLDLDPLTSEVTANSAIGNGLPNVPVNVLRFAPGPGGLLWLGNDLGVFRYTEGQWEQVNGNMPAAFVSDIEFDPAQGKVWVATFGRGLWTAELPCQTQAPVALAADQTWNGDHFIDHQVFVPDGITLTITGKAFFTPDAGITVLPGGKLDIPGGCLGAACDGFSWRGIEAHGQPALTQHPAWQPRVHLSDGAQILGARIGILVGAPNLECGPYGEGGGILLCDRSILRDCEKGIVFAPYRSTFSTGAPKPNASHISRTHFNWASTTPVTENKVHLYLESINRLTVAGCYFENQLDTPNGRGVQTKNATLLLTTSCEQASPSPCSTPIPCTFQNLFRGLDARSWMDSETLRAEGGLFKSCTHAIRTVGVMDASITDCTFELPDLSAPSLPVYGLHLIGSSRYEVQSNSIIGLGGDHAKAGIVVTESEDDPNALRGNSIQGCTWGVLAQGDNKNDAPSADNSWDPGSAFGGLQILCNSFSGNQYDVVVSDDGQIAPWQGSSNAAAPNGITPAGNGFLDGACFDTNALHINPGSLGFHYFYPESTPSMLPAADCISDQVITAPLDLNEWNGCQAVTTIPDVLSGLGMAATLGDELDQVMFDTRLILDGGDSQALMDLVNDSSTDAKAVKVAVLSASPWVSDPVLQAVLERSGLPQLERYGILLANIPLSPNVWHALETTDWLDPVWLEALWTQQRQAVPNNFTKRKLELASTRAERTRVLHACLQKATMQGDNSSFPLLISTLEEASIAGELRLAHALKCQSAGSAFGLPESYPNYPDPFGTFYSGLEHASCDPSCAFAIPSLMDNWRCVAAKSGTALAASEPFHPAFGPVKTLQPNQRSREHLLAFPNPGNTRITLVFPIGNTGAVWQLTTAVGSVIQQGVVPPESEIQLDASSWAAGVYLFAILGENAHAIQWIKH